MIIHATSQYAIYFGDASDQMYPREYLQWQNNEILSKQPIRLVKEQLHLNNVMFLHQRHSCKGLEVTEQLIKQVSPFSQDGDFLITRLPYAGIGIVTADCLPVIVYDRRFHAAGVAHAGWRGAVLRVVPMMLKKMKELYGSTESDFILFFGPSAKRCCYEVSADFIDHLDEYPFSDKVLQRQAGKVFFDLPLFVELQLAHQGINPRELRREYNNCTICDHRFHSYRRGTSNQEANLTGRQMTVITVK